MKRLLILMAPIILGVGCGTRSNNATQIQPPPGANENQPAKKAVTTTATNDSEKSKPVPVEFKDIDFKNRSYAGGSGYRIRLKTGRHEFREGSGGVTFDLRAVDYVDLTGDGKEEAVVRLTQVVCGGSCDGGSYIFYFFLMKHGRLNLLSRIETGSLGYGECGLKAFLLRGAKLDLEVFHVCGFNGVSLKPTADPYPNPDARVGKFVADKFTRFALEFNGSRFITRKREVATNPQEDILGYSPQIEIND